MRILLTAVIITQALIFSVQASTVGWGAAIDKGVGLASATTATSAVLAGSLVRLGYFVAGTDIAGLAAVGNKGALDAAFRQFGQAAVGDGTGGESGVWQSSTPNNQAEFGGRAAYYWVLNAATLSAATQWGIFTATTWVFPTDIATGQLVTDINQVQTAGVIVGGGDGTATIFGGTTPVFKLTPVPEPSTGLLAALGLGAIAARRRRSLR